MLTSSIGIPGGSVVEGLKKGNTLKQSIDDVSEHLNGLTTNLWIGGSFCFLFLNEKLNINKVISVMLMFIASLIIFLSQGNFPFISILIGTTSVENSELISKLLRNNNINHSSL